MTDTLTEVVTKIENAEPKKDPEVESLRQTIGDLTQKLDRLTEITTTLASSQTPAPVETPEPEIDPDVARVIDARVERIVDQRVNTLRTKSKEEQTKEAWDKKADDEFPHLLKSTHPNFSQEFYALVKHEFNNGIHDKNSPDAVYNAACRAQVIIDRRKREAAQQEGVRKGSITAGFTNSTTYAPANRTSELSEEQKMIARKLGVTEEEYKQFHGPVTGRVQ